MNEKLQKVTKQESQKLVARYLQQKLEKVQQAEKRKKRITEKQLSLLKWWESDENIFRPRD